MYVWLTLLPGGGDPAFSKYLYIKLSQCHKPLHVISLMCRWQRGLQDFRDSNGGRCLFCPPAFPENLVMLWDFPSPQSNSPLGERYRSGWQRGVFICIFLGQRTVSPAHPSPASLCCRALSPRSPGASPGHSVLSHFPIPGTVMAGKSHTEGGGAAAQRCFQNGEWIQWHQCPGYQTPREAREVGA